MAQILNYIEIYYPASFLPYGELLLINDTLNWYEAVNELEYQ